MSAQAAFRRFRESGAKERRQGHLLLHFCSEVELDILPHLVAGLVHSCAAVLVEFALDCSALTFFLRAVSKASGITRPTRAGLPPPSSGEVCYFSVPAGVNATGLGGVLQTQTVRPKTLPASESWTQPAQSDQAIPAAARQRLCLAVADHGQLCLGAVSSQHKWSRGMFWGH